MFVFAKDLHRYYVNNIYVKYNGHYARFNSTVASWDLFKLYSVNFLIVVFSLGIASPVVVVRTLRYLIAHSELVGIYNDAQAYQSQNAYATYEYAEAAGSLDLSKF